MSDKELHIWMCEPIILPKLMTYQQVKEALFNGNRIVNTFIPEFCNTMYIEMGYRIFVHMLDHELVEIKLGTNNKHTSKDIRPAHNIHRLLIANSFGFATTLDIPCEG